MTDITASTALPYSSDSDDAPPITQMIPPPQPLPLSAKLAWIGQTEARVQFDKKTPGILRMAIVGSILQFLTFGIYRFWFLVNVRRQLWQRTSFVGSPFEFTGTPGEVFRGFLLALICLAPIWASYYAGSTLIETRAYFATAGILLAVSIVGFLFFGYFATYRAGRYRISRTLWRGVRFRQTGSGILYALMNFGWWIMAIATLGLSMPFARAQLERYRTNNIWCGDRRFESRASGRVIYPLFLLLYAIALVPAIFALVHSYLQLPELIEGIPGEVDYFFYSKTQAGHPAWHERILLQAQMGTLFWDGGILVVMSLLVWPMYLACELRNFIRRTKLGDSTFRCDFGAGAIDLSYLIMIVFMAAGIAIAWFAIFEVVRSHGSTFMMMKSPYLLISLLAGAYVPLLLLYNVLKLRILLFGLAGKLIRSVIVTNLASLMDIVSQSDRVGAIGDDFAGGFDIGAI